MRTGSSQVARDGQSHGTAWDCVGLDYSPTTSSPGGRYRLGMEQSGVIMGGWRTRLRPRWPERRIPKIEGKCGAGLPLQGGAVRFMRIYPTHVGMDPVPERLGGFSQRLPHACGEPRLGGCESPGSRE